MKKNLSEIQEKIINIMGGSIISLIGQACKNINKGIYLDTINRFDLLNILRILDQ